MFERLISRCPAAIGPDDQACSVRNGSISVVGRWLSLTVGAIFPTPVAQAAQPDAAATAYAALQNNDFTDTQDAPTQLISTRMAVAAGEVPAQCVVEGYVAPGGYGGSLEVRTTWCDDALRRGYACMTHDTGYRGVGHEATPYRAHQRFRAWAGVGDQSLNAKQLRTESPLAPRRLVA